MYCGLYNCNKLFLNYYYRYIAGWAVRKEIAACNSYLSKNKGSKSKKTNNRLQKEEKIKFVLKVRLYDQKDFTYRNIRNSTF